MSSQSMGGEEYRRAGALFQEGKHDETLRILDSLLIDDPNQPALLLAKARCLAKMGRTAEATELCHVLKRGESDTRVDELLAQMVQQQRAEEHQGSRREQPPAGRAEIMGIQALAWSPIILRLVLLFGGILLFPVGWVLYVSSPFDESMAALVLAGSALMGLFSVVFAVNSFYRGGTATLFGEGIRLTGGGIEYGKVKMTWPAVRFASLCKHVVIPASEYSETWRGETSKAAADSAFYVKLESVDRRNTRFRVARVELRASDSEVLVLDFGQVANPFTLKRLCCLSSGGLIWFDLPTRAVSPTTHLELQYLNAFVKTINRRTSRKMRKVLTFAAKPGNPHAAFFHFGVLGAAVSDVLTEQRKKGLASSIREGDFGSPELREVLATLVENDDWELEG